MASIIGASNIAIIDGVILALFIFPLGQFKILQYRIINLKTMISKDNSDEEMYKIVVEIAKEHNIIIKLVYLLFALFKKRYF